MKSLTQLQIPSLHIALFGSGNSVHDISEEEFACIKANSFVITLNYAPIHLNGHLNMWSDRKVSDFLQQHYTDKPKDCLLLAQENRVPSSLKHKVDYWFDRKKEDFKGSYTLVWALQLLQKYFPDKKILLFGIDMYAIYSDQAKWYDRYTDFDSKKRGKRYRGNNKLQQCAKQIAQFVSKGNVYNCNPESSLHYFEKKNWKELLKLKILHLCPSSLAGAPVHLSIILNKYTAFESKTILKREFTGKGLNKLRWDYDIVNPMDAQLKDAIKWADVLHHHRSVYPYAIKDKPSILQFHSPPNGYQPGKTHEAFNGRKLVIAQYHPRFYTDALVMPNLIDIWDETFRPGNKPESKINIFYSWASEKKGGWSDKGSEQTIAILKKIASKYGKKVAVKIINNRPYRECMAAKRKAHICIDECVTGSYHLQSLEGCSVGALTFNNIDDQTLSFMSHISGVDEHPFVKTNLHGLYEELCHYIDLPKELKEKGRLARQWMEAYWDPVKLVHRFTCVYFNTLNYNTTIIEKIKIQDKSEDQEGNKIQQTSIPRKPVVIQKRPVLNKVKITKAATQGKKSPVPKKGKSIQELHQKFQGQDIYIFGTGPSLFKTNPEDFRNKICFGINYSFEQMPYIDYVFVHVIETYEAIRKVVENNKLILSETLIAQFNSNQKRNANPRRIVTSNTKAHIYPIQDPTEKSLANKSVILDKKAKIFTWSTTTHSAIHVAAYAGAKNIYLIGMDYELFPNGKVHFASKYCPNYGQQKWNVNTKHRKGDLWLAQELKKVGIKLTNLYKKENGTKLNASKGASAFLNGNYKVTLEEKIKRIDNLKIKKTGKFPQKTEMPLLSICMSVYNRSKVLLANGQCLELFPNCLRSVMASIGKTDNIEIVISDFSSTDWPLEEWVDEMLKDVSYRIIKVEGRFTRGLGRNIAAKHAKGSMLFFLDADMVIDRDILRKGRQLVRQGIVYFPMCFYFLNREHKKGFWCHGKGNVFISKAVFNRAGQWPGATNSLRDFDEDLLFFNKVNQTNVKVINEMQENFYHQYHPGKSVNDILRRRKELILDFDQKMALFP